MTVGMRSTIIYTLLKLKQLWSSELMDHQEFPFIYLNGECQNNIML